MAPFSAKSHQSPIVAAVMRRSLLLPRRHLHPCLPSCPCPSCLTCLHHLPTRPCSSCRPCHSFSEADHHHHRHPRLLRCPAELLPVLLLPPMAQMPELQKVQTAAAGPLQRSHPGIQQEVTRMDIAPTMLRECFVEQKISATSSWQRPLWG